jgi:amidohydrolase
MREWLVAIRRDFHMYPEISNQEIKTTEKIKEILQSLNVTAQKLHGLTGLTALIPGEGNGKTIALRADIDALPIQELNDVPYKSRHDGTMHACGHDVHTTIMLGVAKHIQESGFSKKLKGNVKFLFQPGEERGTGAKEMIAQGVLKNPDVDRILACHVSPDLPIGVVGVNRTQSHASADRFILDIKGKGAHGGHPEEGIDPIVAGSYFVTAVQSIISRNIRPTDTAVITLGTFTAGKVANVIPDQAHLEGTIRAFRNDVREQLIQRVHDIIQGIELTFHVTCRLQFLEGVPACINDEHTSSFLYEAAARVCGSNNMRYLPPVTGSEDFAFFAIERPSAMIRLGCANKEKGLVHMLHSPHFDVDEEVLLIGVRVFTEAIRRALT